MTNCIHVDKHAVERSRGLYSVYSLASLQLNFVFAVLFCFQAHSAVSQLKAVTCTHLRRQPWLNFMWPYIANYSEIVTKLLAGF